MMCRTMHDKDFKKDSPVPYFCLFFVLTPKYRQYFFKNTTYSIVDLVMREMEEGVSRRRERCDVQDDA